MAAAFSEVSARVAAERLAFRVLVPVKDWARAKSRLDLPADRRAKLAEAFALDTLAAASGCADVTEVVVVTDSERVASVCATRVPGVTAIVTGASLNDALIAAAHRTTPAARDHGVAAICADLPALRTADVAVVLRAVPEPGGVVADLAGTGTTLIAARSPRGFIARFGPDSFAAHRAAGLADLTGSASRRLRHDVDTVADLEAWDHADLGSATRAIHSTVTDHA